MELEEFDVAKLGPDLMGQRPAIGSGNLGVGGDRIQLADPTCREYHRWRSQLLGGSTLADQGNTGDLAILHHQTGNLGVLQNLDLRVVPNDLRQTAD
jgi:hypothetical protein